MFTASTAFNILVRVFKPEPVYFIWPCLKVQYNKYNTISLRIVRFGHASNCQQGLSKMQFLQSQK